MFLQNAKKGDSSWYLWVITFFLVVFGYGLGQVPLSLTVAYLIENDSTLDLQAVDQFFENPDFALLGINSTFGLVLMICMFLFALIGLFIGVKFLHKRSFLSLVYFKEKIRLKQLVFGFVFWLVALLIIELISFGTLPADYIMQSSWSDFIPLLLVSIFFLPIQTSTEELLVRGYMMQGFGLLSNSKIIPLLLSTLFFGLIHGSNPEIAEYGFWTMQVYYLSAGLFLGLITLMDDGLELALGAHAAINIFGATLVSYNGAAIQTDSLFKVTQIYPIVMTGGFIIAAIIFVLIAKKKFNWPAFSYLLVKPFQKEIA